jgi:DNA-directed RNA polymerase specialized sigma24 family protein
LAPLFGGSVGAVKTRLSRARRAFREAYQEVGGRVDDVKRET